MSLSTRLMAAIAIITILLCGSVNALAGKDPISITLTPSSGLSAQTMVGNSYSVVYTLTNNLFWQQPVITSEGNVPGFIVTDECNGKTLSANGGQCTIAINFQPVKVGFTSMQVTLKYGNNTIQIPSLSTIVQAAPAGNITGVVTKKLPANAQIGTAYAVEFTFTNNGNVSVTDSDIQFTGQTLTNVTNGCSSSLAPNQPCVISGTFTPTATGAASVGVTYFYDSNSKSVPLTTTTVVSGGGSCTGVNGSTDLLLPTQTYQFADNVVKFTFTNECDNASAILGNVNLAATLNNSPTGILTKGTDTCSGQTLAANDSCSVSVSIVPQTTGSNLAINAKVSYTESDQQKQAAASTSAAVVNSNITTGRMITVVNQCSFPVWMSFQPGSVQNKTGGVDCASNADCPANTTCNTAANGGHGTCYWSNPSLDGNHPNGKLAGAQANAVPDTMNITVPETYGDAVTPAGTIYNAGIVARQGCTGTGTGVTCAVNSCTAGADGMCFPGNGAGTNPVAFNAVEFTFNKTGGDGVLDLQVIDGLNVPIEMKGRGNVGAPPYANCTAVGAPIQPLTGTPTTQLGNCNFNLNISGADDDPSNYRYVTPVGVPSTSNLCDTDADCAAFPDTVCGLGYFPGPTENGYPGNKVNKICGTLQGYVSVNKGICSQANLLDGGKDKAGNDLKTTLYTGTFHCDASYSENSITYSGTDVYACTTPPLNTCYGNNTPCCGCVDWWNQSNPLKNLTVPSDTATCAQYGNHTNANWASLAQPHLQWLKAACPTAYVYQYDDKSSSFTCSVKNTSQQVVTNYQVTFCPGGEALQMN